MVTKDNIEDIIELNMEEHIIDDVAQLTMPK